MENNKHHIENEEINNPAQFQIGRNSSEKEGQEENSYTPQENEFADGKGTPLNEELGEKAPEQDATNNTKDKK
jgi:single-stranded DNA-binding protein